MTLKQYLITQKISTYRLSKQAQIPYSTLIDLVNEKTKLTKCTVEVAFKISKALNMTVEELVDMTELHKPVKKMPFELFKSTMRHQLHDLGDKAFVRSILSEDLVERYAAMAWYPEALYTLALLDVLCSTLRVPLATKYESYRTQKLDQILYPSDIMILSLAQNDERIKQDAFEKSLPEFKRFNIVEREIRDVI